MSLPERTIVRTPDFSLLIEKDGFLVNEKGYGWPSLDAFLESQDPKPEWLEIAFATTDRAVIQPILDKYSLKRAEDVDPATNIYGTSNAPCALTAEQQLRQIEKDPRKWDKVVSIAYANYLFATGGEDYEMNQKMYLHYEHLWQRYCNHRKAQGAGPPPPLGPSTVSVPKRVEVRPLAPKTMLRYDGPEGRCSAVVLANGSILAVKHNGSSHERKSFATMAEWLSSLPGTVAEQDIHIDAPTDAKKIKGPEPITDVEWLLAACPSAISRHRRRDWVGEPLSASDTAKPLRFHGRGCFFILGANGEPPTPLHVSCEYGYSRDYRNYTSQKPAMYYKNKSGTTFAQLGVPVNSKTGWPNIWRLQKTTGQFTRVLKPVV